MISRQDSHTNARRLALCGVLCALAVTALILSGLLSLTLYYGPILAMLILLPIHEEYGSRLALTAYFAVVILALLLSPNREPAWLYLFWGWYTSAQSAFHRIRHKSIRCLVIWLVGCGTTAAMYAVLLYVFRLEALTVEFAEYTRPLMAALVAMMGILFLILDFLLTKFRRGWQVSGLRKRWRRL